MTWPTLAGPLTNDFVDMIHSGSRTAIKVSREDVEVNQPSLIDVIRESQRIAGKTAAKVVEMGERLIATFDTATGKISVTDINGKEYGFGRLRKDVSQPTSKEWALSLNGKDTNHPTRGTALSHAVRYLEGIHRDAAKDPRFKGVSVDQDDEGYYVKTHRARSKSYPSEDAIPDSVVAEIERTGSKTAFQVHRVGMHDAETTVTLASGTTMTLYYWGSPSWSRAVKAETPAGAEAGYLTWDSRKIIGGVHTQPRWRRQGLATAMLEFARSFDPDIRHSHALTEDGEAWADKVGKSALCTEGSFGYYMREHRDMASLGPDHELVKPRTLTELRRFAQEVMDRVSGWLKADLSLISGDWSETYPPQADGTVVMKISDQPQNRHYWTVLHEIAHAQCHERGLDAFDNDHGPGFRTIFYQEMLPQYGVNLRTAGVEKESQWADDLLAGGGMVTIYRATPVGVSEFRPGDWVALDELYSLDHAQGFSEKEGRPWHVISRSVPAAEVQWAGERDEWYADTGEKREFFWVGPGATTASLEKTAALTPAQVEHIRDARDYCVQTGNTNFMGGPSCGYTTEIISEEDPTFEQVWGAFRRADGGQPEHVWLTMADGTIVDPTADQFGHEPIRVLRPGDPGYADYLAGVDGDDLRTASLEKTAADLMVGQGLYYRVHHLQRAFSVDDAWSAPLTISFDDDLDEPREGYSCYPTPWEVWAYVALQGWTKRTMRDEILIFSGEEVGTGIDGEPLVIPDGRVERFIPWRDFLWSLSRMTGRFADGKIDGPRGSVSYTVVAPMALEEDPTDPVGQRIMQDAMPAPLRGHTAPGFGMLPMVASTWPTLHDASGRTMTWAEVQATYPTYDDQYIGYGVDEIANAPSDGTPIVDSLVYTLETVDIRTVRFVRYDAGDARFERAREGYQSGATMTPPLLVRRAGELLTVDGNHRLSAALAAGRTQIEAIVAQSPRSDPYTGRGAPGTVGSRKIAMGPTEWPMGALDHTAGPASNMVPFTTFPVYSPTRGTSVPRDVKVLRMAERDIARLDPGQQRRVREVIEDLKAGRAPVEEKTRPPLDATYTVRVTRSLRLGLFLSDPQPGGADPHRDWIVYWVGDHNYEEAERRMRNKPKVASLRTASPTLNTLNPSGGVFVGYEPEARATAPLGPNLTTLAETQGVPPQTPVRIYRGADESQQGIVPGDFVTTNEQLARDYAGAGEVLSLDVTYGDVLDDRTEPGGEEYIYRPGGSTRTAAWSPDLVWTEEERGVTVREPGGRMVAYLTWHGSTGQVNTIWVHQDYQRQGIATEMFRRGKEIEPWLDHDYDRLSNDAQEWVKTLGSRTASSGTYYHGTSVPLSPGARIAPSRPLGDPGSWDTAQPSRGPSERYSDPAVAYATSSLEDAWWWAEHAWNAGRGDLPRVYQVRPLGEVYPDPNNELAGDVVSPVGFEVISEVTEGDDYEMWKEGSVAGLTFEHEESRTGGSKWPVQHDLVAMLDGVEVGRLTYLTGTRANSKVLIDSLYVDDRFRRRGIGSALMDEMQRRRPGASIDHGDRTDDGKAWWSGYTRGRSVTRGRTMASLGGLTFTHHRQTAFSEDKGLHPADWDIVDTLAARDGGEVVGVISWYADEPGSMIDGGIDLLWVREDRRRQGIATDLLARAKTIYPAVEATRSPSFTDDGKAFVNSLPGVYISSVWPTLLASDYWMSHRPGSDGPPLHDLLQGGDAPRDIYQNPHYYTGGYGGASQEAIRVIQDVRGKPDAMVTIYRSLPPNVPQQINPGDWISLSRSYAEMHGMDRGWDEWVEPATPRVFNEGEGWISHEGDWPVVSRQVPAWQVRWDVNDLVEMGWFPDAPRTAALGERTAMSVEVEKTGLDEVDEIVGTLVRDFLAENPDVNDYRVPENAHGYCEIVADRFTEFCTGRGYRAYTEADYTDVWGYEPKGPAQGGVLDEDGNIVTGYYDEHAATSIYGLPGRHLPVSVDFTSAQYGYTEFFPYVHGSLGKTAAVGPRKVAKSLPGGVDLEYEEVEPGLDRIAAYGPFFEEVGSLSWWTQTGEIHEVWVETRWQRMGIATEMWHLAREHEPRLHHSMDMSEEAEAWAASLERTASSLSLEDYISVAEHAVENSHPAAKRLHHLPDKSAFPKAYENDDYWAAMKPTRDLVVGILAQAGKHMHSGFKVTGDGWHVTQMGAQGATDGANWMDLRSPATLLTILHECAHIIRGTSEGQGHDKGFVDVMASLLATHVSPAAADQFKNLVGFHDEMKTEGALPPSTKDHSVRPDAPQFGMEFLPDPPSLPDEFHLQKSIHPWVGVDWYHSEPERDVRKECIRVFRNAWGSPLGGLWWRQDTGRITEVKVDDRFRRMGLATAMLEAARAIDPRVHHSDDLTPDGQAWMQAVGSVPAGYDLVYTPPKNWNNGQVAALLDGQVVGHIQFVPAREVRGGERQPDGSIKSVLVPLPAQVVDLKVNAEHRRKGIATALWEEARRHHPDLVHDSIVLPDGEAWIKSLGSAKREIVVSSEGHLWTWRCSVCGEGPPNRGYRDKDMAREMGHTHAQWCWDLGWDDEVMVREAGKTAALHVQKHDGKKGERDHITQVTVGPIPTDLVKDLPGRAGEVPGEHRNRRGEAWEEFKVDVTAGGIREPIFIVVEETGEAFLYEGNHRRDAAVEVGLPTIPAVIRFFGKSEDIHPLGDLR